MKLILSGKAYMPWLYAGMLKQAWLLVLLLLLLSTALYAQPNITRVEYYIDNDPGFGNGTALSITPAKDLSNLSIDINPASLTQGVHQLNVRAKDANGSWSLTSRWLFFKPYTNTSTALPVAKISRVEWYIDNDPGFGNATAVSIAPATDLSNLMINIDPVSLTSGVHQFNVRAKDELGNWSLTNRWLFFKPFNATATAVPVPALTRLEYYIDNDPGFGNGIPVAVNSTNMSDVHISLNISGLAKGTHKVYLRAKDANGSWSLTNEWEFNIPTGINGDAITITNVVPATICSGSTITASYNAVGTFTTGNTFELQLSSATGDFTNPVKLGAINSTATTSTITGNVPLSIAAGTAYRVRVISVQNSFATPIANADDITIKARPVMLGNDKNISLACDNSTANITTVYNTNSYTDVAYSTPTPMAAPAGSYSLMVTNTDGCRDTATINVLYASIAPVMGVANSKTASRECTDASGWTHYYNDNGTPADYSDDIRLLSIKKNGNDIGTVGDGTFVLTVAATAGANSGRAVIVNNNLTNPFGGFYSMNRYWNITPTHQPTTNVGIRFYYNTYDLTDVNGSYPNGPVAHTQLQLYKLQNGNPDPTTNWAGATGAKLLFNGGTPDIDTWVYSSLGGNIHQAEFMVSRFSGGGAGASKATAGTALPVTLLSFTAQSESNKVQLNWRTASEQNSKAFVVQRSSDGINFNTMGTVAANGNSNIAHNYMFTDEQPLSGTSYYRLQMVDIDGQFTYSHIATVKRDIGNKVMLYPNPVHDILQVHIPYVTNETLVLEIHDNTGKRIQQKTVIANGSTYAIRVSSLANGVYYLVIKKINNTEVYPFVKE